MLEKKMVTIEKVQQDKVVQIGVSGSFYQRLHAMFKDSMINRDGESYIAALEKVFASKDKPPEDREALHIETMIILLHNLETAFKEAGYMDKEDLEIEVDTSAKKTD